MKSAPPNDVPTLKLLHEAKDASFTGDKSLFSLVLADNSITGSILDKAAKKFVLLRSYQADDPISILLNNEKLEGYFPETKGVDTRLFLHNYKIALVPDAIYSDGHKEKLFSFNHQLGDEEQVCTAALKNMGSRLLFAIPVALADHLKSTFPETHILHSSAAWIDCLYLLNKTETDMNLHVHIDKQGIQVAVFREGQLQFYNSFIAGTAEDKLYFIMFVSEQLRVNPGRDAYYISGMVTKGEEIYDLMRKYIRHLQWESRPALYDYSLPVSNLPEHFYFQSYCTPVCE